MNGTEKIKVLIIDDSALMRQLLSEILRTDKVIEVVGVAADPYIARHKIKSLNPDVLTLDIEMPGMNGIDFLEKLMRLRPTPVVMVSSHTKNGAQSTLRALELGAFDFVTKPEIESEKSIDEFSDGICAKVKAAAKAHLLPGKRLKKVPAKKAARRAINKSHQDSFIVIGASAGGTEAIREILIGLPADMPGIAIVQHMPVNFTTLFAERLNNQCALNVREARNGDSLTGGKVLIAPGGKQMEIISNRNGYEVKVYDGEPVNRHCPSVDVLFNSAANHIGQYALGMILTGMGRDGAEGLLAMRRSGAYTLAQDETSCVVFGMPDQAINRGAVCDIVSLSKIADHIVNWLSYDNENIKSHGYDL